MTYLFDQQTRSLPSSRRLIALGTLALPLLLLVSTCSLLTHPNQEKAAQAAGTSFTFTAVGDYGQTKNTTANLRYIARSGAKFNLALGDLNYDYPTVSAQQWSSFVKSYLPSSFPFEIVVGEHDTGDIAQLAAELPDHLGSTGIYSNEYSFDYPASTPLARFILVSPGPMVKGARYNKGGADYNWVKQSIESARQAGIRWVIVGLHRYCLVIGSAHDDTCTAPDLMNLLISEKVEVVLTGEKHGYQATKQLAFNGTSCPSIVPGNYNSACVVNASTSLIRGQGTVFVITGAGGKSLGDVDTTDPETGYFRTWMGGNVNPTWGVSKFTVSATKMSMQFVATSAGTFSDSLTIQG
jgi:hypothetical protein